MGAHLILTLSPFVNSMAPQRALFNIARALETIRAAS